MYQAFGIYKNKCEGVNYWAKPIKIRKVKPIKIKTKIRQIYDDVVLIKEKLELLQMRK